MFLHANPAGTSRHTHTEVTVAVLCDHGLTHVCGRLEADADAYGFTTTVCHASAWHTPGGRTVCEDGHTDADLYEMAA